MKQIFISLGLVIGLLPGVALARMQDPYPINANDNRTVFTAAVGTAVALSNARPVYQAAPPVSQFAPAHLYPVVTTVGTPTQFPSATAYAPVHPVSVQTHVTAPMQTFAGVGTNSASMPAYPTAVLAVASVPQNTWTTGLPVQSLVPASVATAPLSLGSALTSLNTNYSASYTNSLPGFYGPGATQGVYTVYGGQSYDAQAVYNRGLSQATGTYGNASNQFNTLYTNTNTQNASAGSWVQSPGGWVQVGARSALKGNMPW